MGKTTTSSLINYYDDEFDDIIAETIEKYAQCNIRFRSPNRKSGTTHPKKVQKPEWEAY